MFNGLYWLSYHVIHVCSQGDQVYSVKWYKGGLEIFRHIPTNSPPMAVFSRPGVNIDTKLSNSTLLHLSNLTVASTGRYRYGGKRYQLSLSVNK